MKNSETPAGAAQAAPPAKKQKTRERVKSFFADFVKFINRGNIIDLAVAVVIGAAFTKIVNSLVADIIMPLIGLMTGSVDVAAMKWQITDTLSLNWGAFVWAIFDFIIVAFFIFIVLRMLVNAERGITHLRKKQLKLLKKAAKNGAVAPPPEAETPPPAHPIESQTDILNDIRSLLRALTEKDAAEPERNSGQAGRL
ncbi:MAG: large conductance mechanosensitive channel protein MscL [Clostridiales bacterium]|jgi:large conductance mechanosensitive channel|nr:large conductance mechanosensitive channel protein MscL [Clostridiales bacterium]